MSVNKYNIHNQSDFIVNITLKVVIVKVNKFIVHICN